MAGVAKLAPSIITAANRSGIQRTILPELCMFEAFQVGPDSSRMNIQHLS